MPSQKPTSLLEVLQGSADFLKKQQIEHPRLNAEHLLAHVLKMPRLELYLQFERQLTEAELVPLRELLRKRSKGIPLQHLLGTVEFFGRTFLSDPRGLIPRPETEQLLERALTHTNLKNILDLGTGSGVIAITLALEKKDAEITAIDLSPEALTLAQENATRHKIDSINWLQGNLLDPLKIKSSKSFDLIIANLPYIPTDEIKTLAPEVHHDPIMALDGGNDGLDLIQQLVEQAPEHLLPGGRLLLEIGKDQAETTMGLLKKNKYHDITALPDYQGVLRFVEAVQRH